MTWEHQPNSPRMGGRRQSEILSLAEINPVDDEVASSEDAWQILKTRSISDFFSVWEMHPDLGGGAPSCRTNCGFIFKARFYTQLCPPNPLRWPKSPSNAYVSST